MLIRRTQIEPKDSRLSGELFDHFWGNPLTGSNTGLVYTTAGTGAASSIAGGNFLYPGIARLSTGTTATGYASYSTFDSSLLWNNQIDLNLSIAFRIPTLATTGENFRTIVGFGDVSTGAHATDGIYIYYDSANADLMCRSTNNGTSTDVDSNIAVGAGTWYVADINLPRSGTATVQINGTLVATLTTNLPYNNTARAFGLQFSILKLAGTTARTLDLDYYSLKWAM